MEPEQRGRSSVERLIERHSVDRDGLGRPLSSRARQTRRSVEAYLKSGLRPRWMERLADIDRGVATEWRRLERAYRTVQEDCRGEPGVFARRWSMVARSWPFDALNELIHQHNDWYPIERQLPMDPRTGDYVRVGGRSYRRPVLGPEWVLEHFPPTPPGGA
ncbi:MAG: hypothetical protein QOJ82_4260 [Solirubrobacteraceae bacterium]|jgi:hypothetical protein|nr:hypothetical protein [Solirubrobacteraceae bacterium]